MRFLNMTAAIVVFLITLTSCADEGTPTEYNNVVFHSRIENPPSNTSVSRPDGNSSAAVAVSSITVTQVRMLMSRLMLHVEHQPDNVDNRMIHNGPLVLRAVGN